MHLERLVRFFNPLYALRAVFRMLPLRVDFFPRSLFIFAPHAFASLLPFLMLR